jgi:hypothetical protein
MEQRGRVAPSCNVNTPSPTFPAGLRACFSVAFNLDRLIKIQIQPALTLHRQRRFNTCGEVQLISTRSIHSELRDCGVVQIQKRKSNRLTKQSEALVLPATNGRGSQLRQLLINGFAKIHE